MLLKEQDQLAVIPAWAGIYARKWHRTRTWIPAFAGMTMIIGLDQSLIKESLSKSLSFPRSGRDNEIAFVIPPTPPDIRFSVSGG